VGIMEDGEWVGECHGNRRMDGKQPAGRRRVFVQTETGCVLGMENDESRKCVFEEGGLGPLLWILETGSMPMKEKASAAVEAITVDPENLWAVSAYGGVSVLIEACRSGSVVTQSHAVGAIRNVAHVEEIKNSLAEEGAVPVLIQLLVTGTSSTQEKAANCIALLASSGEYFRASIVQQRGVHRLMVLIQEVSNPETLEHVLRAISSLSGFDSSTRILSSSTAFIAQPPPTTNSEGGLEGDGNGVGGWGRGKCRSF
jgi:hypothetical protein